MHCTAVFKTHSMVTWKCWWPSYFSPLRPLWSLSYRHTIISPHSTCAGVAPLAAWCWLSSQHCTGRLYSATHRGLSSWRLSAALGCHNVCLVLISRWRIDSLRKSQTCFIVQLTRHRERYPLNAEFSIKMHWIGIWEEELLLIAKQMIIVVTI